VEDFASTGIGREFVALPSPTQARAGAGGHPCQGLYWTPSGARPKTAVIATHYNVDFAEHYIAPYFATRGFGFLGWNTRYRGAEDLFALEHALIDIAVGMKWLRDEARVERIVILGNSGGGSLMAAYQAEAVASTLAESAGTRVKETLAQMPKADLYISLNAHPGRPDVLTNWMDASVVDETDPAATDEYLDPFRAENAPPYSADFITRYRAAQRARNQKITDWAKRELARLNAAGIPDRVFPLFRTWADLRFMDPAIDPSERPVKCILFQCATDLSAGLDAFDSGTIDVVVTDMKLPAGETNGLALTRMIGNGRARAPVILMTTYPELLEGEVALPGSVLCNPLEIAELCREIKARLAQ